MAVEGVSEPNPIKSSFMYGQLAAKQIHSSVGERGLGALPAANARYRGSIATPYILVLA